MLIAGSALAVSFLGPQALESNSGPLTALVLFIFLISVTSAVYVLIPRAEQFTFSLSGLDLYIQFYEWRDNPDEIDRRLTYDMVEFWDANDVSLQKLVRSYQSSAVMMLVEMETLSVMASGIVG